MTENTTNAHVAKNLLKTIFQRGRGSVNKSSIVPSLFSSDQLFIVTAEIKKIKTQGIKLKKTVKSATPDEKKDPKEKVRDIEVRIQIAVKIYATGVMKYNLSSLLINANINLQAF